MQHFNAQNCRKRKKKKEQKCSIQPFGTRASLQNILKN